jgi:hypothetical protein
MIVDQAQLPESTPPFNRLCQTPGLQDKHFGGFTEPLTILPPPPVRLGSLAVMARFAHGAPVRLVPEEPVVRNFRIQCCIGSRESENGSDRTIQIKGETYRSTTTSGLLCLDHR